MRVAVVGSRGYTAAIGEFLESEAGKAWVVKRHYENNNGLLVLERVK